MLNFDFLEKGLGIVSPSYFVYYFSKKKKNQHVTLYQLTKYHCLVAFTS